MKISCLQMDMKLGCAEENLIHAESLIRRAAADGADVIVLPETWNSGFFPKKDLFASCCNNGAEVKSRIGALAKELCTNIVAGSVSNLRGDKVFNTALVFGRNGECVAEYDKTHLFTPMGEDDYYTRGDHLCTFMLDGVKCGLMICYDLRFPELARTLALQGAEVLFVVSQWPKERVFHLRSLLTARAIENQAFVACCNSCGRAEETVYGGNSCIIDPLGETLSTAGEAEQTISVKCDISEVGTIRSKIPVFKDRRRELYSV